MAKKKLHAVLILDETGSMYSRKTSTISGYNEYVQTLKAKKTKGLRFTLVSFNSIRTIKVCEAVKVKDIPELTAGTYMPGGNTPLHDTIGATIRELEKVAGANDGALVIILTDGEENDSREWSRQQVYDLIKEKQAAGWKFVFLGADVDAYAAGHVDLGIDANDCATYVSGCTEEVIGATVARVSMEYVATGGLSTGGTRTLMSETVPGALKEDSRYEAAIDETDDEEMPTWIS